MSQPRHPATELIHHPYQPPTGFDAPQLPVHKASTVIFPNVAAMRSRDWRHKTGYTYGLHGTPTTFTLEERIATLEGARHCALVPSGLAAVALVDQALLSQGDEVLLPANAYGPGLELKRRELARWGITHQIYDPMDPASLAALLEQTGLEQNGLEQKGSEQFDPEQKRPRARLVWVEAPGSITMEFPDMPALAALAHQHGALVALDNTWGAGLAFNGFELGADVVMQALTKFPSGGGDVLMGSVCTRDDALHETIKLCHMRLGLGVAANDAELVLRSLATMPLRYEAQDRSARALAQWLQGRPEVARVLHPALPGSPGHEHWQRDCTAAAGLFSVLFDARFNQAQVDRFVDSLRLYKIGFSWAGPVSLAVPYDLAQLRPGQHWPGHLVRLSIGFEEVPALQADLAQALAQAFSY